MVVIPGTEMSVDEIRNCFENQLHAHVSSIKAHAHAELRVRQAMQDCMNQSRTSEARCELILTQQEAQNQADLLEIRQHHDALAGVEDKLSAARSAESVLYQHAQIDFNPLRDSNAEELAEIRERAAEEVSCAQAQVAVHEEVLQRFTSNAAAKAMHTQAELQSAAARAQSAAEKHHSAELLRERDAHQRAMGQLEATINLSLLSMPVSVSLTRSG